MIIMQYRYVYLQSSYGYSDVGRPSGVVLQKPRYLVGTPVEERVSGYRVPALGRQSFPQG